MAKWVWAESAAKAYTEKGGSYKPAYDEKTGKQHGWLVYPEEGGEPDAAPIVEEAPPNVPEGEPAAQPPWSGFSGGGGLGGDGSGGGGGGGGGGGVGGGRTISGVGPISGTASSGSSSSGPVIGRAGIERLLSQFQQFRQSGLGQLGGLYGNMQSLVDQTSAQGAEDIRRDYAEAEARQQAQLQQMGLGGSSAASTMRLGVLRERESALNRFADQMLSQRLNILGAQSGQLGTFIQQYIAGIPSLATAGVSSQSQRSAPQAIGGNGQIYGASSNFYTGGVL